ncbi:McrB family protein [Chitinophaga sp. CF418]|uniref:McrB family protein n=1 Tax=Chitinophaga sp. CF418 TaxID=1855287 RepID=UPI0009226F25|nr:hypothetical protein [Chitinophaga sp. CF418]SHN43725.1 hypothetical protein SAMN05216311_11628 [Chitinophaga sp. CF418]
MRNIISSKTAIKSLKERRYRAYKTEDEILGLDKQSPEGKIGDIDESIASNKLVKKKRSAKKGVKSGITLSSTFPNNVDFNHPYRQALMAIKTKPFIVMTGMCGTGKSRFARILAYQTCPKKLQEAGRAGNFLMLSVQTEWLANDEIIGWLSNQGIYYFTTFIEFLIKAWKHVDTPFILCLDEMNLAKVEQYFADFLSILETRRWINDELVSDAFISGEKLKFYAERDQNIWTRFGLKLDDRLRNRFLTNGITLPPNLIVIGTANMDENGHTFSMKVLDRISVLELTEIDFYSGIKSDDADFKFPINPISLDTIMGRLLYGKEAYELSQKNGDLIISELQAIDKMLTKSHFRFGYRIRDAALIYCAYNSKLYKNQYNEEIIYKCLDEILLMKILPRINGSGEAVIEVVSNLLHLIKHKYPRSFERLSYMLYQGQEHSFISFWQ